MSTKLFILAWEGIFKKLDWSEKQLNVNGERLNHLMVADNTIPINDNEEELKIMITELEER